MMKITRFLFDTEVSWRTIRNSEKEGNQKINFLIINTKNNFYFHPNSSGEKQKKGMKLSQGNLSNNEPD